MKKFSFSMQSVLNINITRRDVAMAEVAEVNQRIAVERSKLSAIDNEMQQALNPSRNMYSSMDYMLQRERHMARLRDRRLYVNQDLEALNRMLTNATDKLRLASLEVRKMEKAYDRQKERWNYELNCEEQKINDEIGSSRFLFARG